MGEVLRKISLEGMAVGFGSGLIAGIGYQLLKRVGAPAGAHDDVIQAAMTVGLIVGLLVSARRNR